MIGNFHTKVNTLANQLSCRLIFIVEASKTTINVLEIVAGIKCDVKPVCTSHVLKSHYHLLLAEASMVEHMPLYP